MRLPAINAYLISAAPVMLAILEAIVAADDAALAELATLGPPIPSEARVLTEQARAAVALARGGQR